MINLVLIPARVERGPPHNVFSCEGMRITGFELGAPTSHAADTIPLAPRMIVGVVQNFAFIN